MISSLTYYLELHDVAISFYWVCHISPKKCQIGCLDIRKHQQLYLEKNIYINSKKDIAL